MRRFLHDFLRVALLMFLAGVILFWADPANAVVFQSLGIGIFVVGGSHLTRRILFPRLDLQAIALRAVEENNFSAAVVFVAVCVVLVAIMFISMRVLS